jgi:hypothetical protein
MQEKIEAYTTTTMTQCINELFNTSFAKKWYETYWAVDIHSTLLVPTYDRNDLSVNYYPYAKEVMQILTQRIDINLILWTSSYPVEIEHYIKVFKRDGIIFDNINDNPNISSKNGNFGYYEKKFYFNILFDDKAGFKPLVEWPVIYKLMLMYNKLNYLPDPSWSTKF